MGAASEYLEATEEDHSPAMSSREVARQRMNSRAREREKRLSATSSAPPEHSTPTSSAPPEHSTAYDDLAPAVHVSQPAHVDTGKLDARGRGGADFEPERSKFDDEWREEVRDEDEALMLPGEAIFVSAPPQEAGV